ncbi:GNAT family N-acetyltransferase [Maribacter aestuarii]|uniref:GNAT family N-acetyltransferase n=1 Tax=Maribacter aestuarii TaxID=1130723 RepID=UPI00248ACF44|nr:GNAT family N-acetyltransferase [Maribacter aestuarii]
MIIIKKADLGHLRDIAPLFDSYRMFYGQESNLEKALKFLEDRLSKEESIIFLAYENDLPVGFVQLYFTFSSVSLQKSLILNDLFVSEEYRKKKVGQALLEKSKSYCIANGYKGLALETAVDNPAQKLYERLDWKKDSHCFHYFWSAE